MRKAICKYCNEEFEYSNRGKERVHCQKAECIRKAKNDAQRKWYANKVKKELAGENIKIVSKETKPQIVYSSKDRENNRLEKEDFSDIIEVSRELGAVRFKIIEMLNKENKKQSFYDGQDQDFLHKLENLEEITDTEEVNMIIEEKRKRETRRSHKMRQTMLRTMINGMPKNPNAYVVETIKNRDNFKYRQRVKENEQ